MPRYISRKTKIILSCLGVVIFIYILTSVINKIQSDGMENSGILTVKYRVHMKDKDWSKWSKNGHTAGNLKNSINGFDIKIKNDNDSDTLIHFFDDKWSESINSSTVLNKISKKNYKGIQLDTYYGISKKYDICYRTYNDENKWLDWVCNGEKSGNKNQNFKGIQIKIIPINVVKSDYLRDYGKKYYSNVGL